MELIDTHCHLDVSEFDPDRAEVLARTRAASVGALVIPGIAAASWEALLACCAAAPTEGPRLYPALGLHPFYLDGHRAADLGYLESLLAAHRLVAIGEIGLDRYVDGLDLDRQIWFFKRQLAIARAAGLPVILHVRKAHEEVLTSLRYEPVPAGGIVHAFNGSLEQGRRYLDLGFRLGFGGMLTFARSSRLRRLALELPLAAIVLETDAPDLTVASHRGERNSPEYLPEVLAALAELRELAPDTAAAQTTANACAVLRLN
ncbi:TatD family hydrolase [Caldichromatium japonicum]|uniref:TatD family hydrolase n=1 Tax=Caldichromatium japonicum TaxID=2699430 RepID=A0A6G7VED7_9GAMM|nr:TatD family hydrolase [Caldichromatium japonicum]QIK38157.1 TatD family hydrolase [Caldichromatium japonicum]